jgi:PAS domain S-box-containing protein
MDGRLILVGPQSKDLFGVAWEEILGKTAHDLVPETISKEFADSLVAHDRLVLESGQASEQEDEVALEDGIHTILTVKFPIPDALGGYLGIGAIHTDITERKRLESELLRQERMATLGQLTATVSHELRNPLGVIRTSAFVLREGLNGEAPNIRRSLERIERSVVRCDRIIDELLDFTRISDLVLEPTAIDAWLEETLNEQVMPPGVALRLELAMPDMAVPFDRDRFRRAIINVFDNGYQAIIGKGREDTDSAEHSLTVRTRKHDGRVEVIFEDTGPGIAPEVYEHIFEPLFSTKGFGVGLGLPVVKQIMEQHGGGIEIESEEGRGARVCLWLPISHSIHGLRAHGGP